MAESTVRRFMQSEITRLEAAAAEVAVKTMTVRRSHETYCEQVGRYQELTRQAQTLRERLRTPVADDDADEDTPEEPAVERVVRSQRRKPRGWGGR
jgi:hypothetical protein